MVVELAIIIVDIVGAMGCLCLQPVVMGSGLGSVCLDGMSIELLSTLLQRYPEKCQPGTVCRHLKDQ